MMLLALFDTASKLVEFSRTRLEGQKRLLAHAKMECLVLREQAQDVQGEQWKHRYIFASARSNPHLVLYPQRIYAVIMRRSIKSHLKI